MAFLYALGVHMAGVIGAGDNVSPRQILWRSTWPGAWLLMALDMRLGRSEAFWGLFAYMVGVMAATMAFRLDKTGRLGKYIVAHPNVPRGTRYLQILEVA